MDVSVLIPTYNRASLLPKVLDAWKEVDKATRYEYEIIFSDDQSSDDTVSMLKKYQNQLPIVILDNEHGGASRARNNGLRHAKGTKILSIGDDIFPNPQWINQHYELALKHGPETAILGEVKWHPELELNYLMHHITEVGHEQFSFNAFPPHTYVDWRHFYTSNISVDRQFLMSEAIIFDERFYTYGFEDAELGYRLSNRGLKILYAPEAYADHYHPYAIAGFCKRQESAGEMAVVFTRLHPEVEGTIGVERTWRRYSKFRESRLSKLPTLTEQRIDFDTVIRLCESYEKELTTALRRERQYIKMALSSLYARLFLAFYELGILKKLEPDNQDYSDYLAKVYFDAGGFWDSYLQASDRFRDLSESDRRFRESLLLNQCLLTRAEMHLALTDSAPELVQNRELALARKELDRINESYAWLIGRGIVYPVKAVRNVIKRLLASGDESAAQADKNVSQAIADRPRAEDGNANSSGTVDPLIEMSGSK
jgi:glycosyltransferase involved in cell wall biosynthesis